jgi:hypothetical protein
MVHLPLLRAGRPYASIDRLRLSHVRGGEPVVEVSQANAGLIARDLMQASAHRRALARVPAQERIAICRRAAELFVHAELPLDPEQGTVQGPDDYVACLSATTGIPQAVCRLHMEKLRFVLAEMATVVGGLTRGLDLAALDGGWVRQEGRMVSYRPQTDLLGGVLPSNAPGVHTLWVPAIAFGVPLALKPGGQEPWTPMRLAQALLAAGCPPEALSLYPSDHAGASTLLLRCGRSLFFGDAATVKPWSGDGRVQLHGPGISKVLLGADAASKWPSHLDLLAGSIAGEGGRSCLNASGVWTASHGRELAEALAERLVSIQALPLDHPDARLAAFADPRTAHAISAHLDRLLQVSGAEDVTGRLRGGASRVVEVDGCTYLLPTLVRCDDPEHPLAHCELLFPFAAVVEVPQDELLSRIGPTLTVSAIGEDAAWRSDLLRCTWIDRLNLGAIPTNRVAWDQPHEGNLFEHLFRQRALQLAAGA